MIDKIDKIAEDLRDAMEQYWEHHLDAEKRADVKVSKIAKRNNELCSDALKFLDQVKPMS